MMLAFRPERAAAQSGPGQAGPPCCRRNLLEGYKITVRERERGRETHNQTGREGVAGRFLVRDWSWPGKPPLPPPDALVLVNPQARGLGAPPKAEGALPWTRKICPGSPRCHQLESWGELSRCHPILLTSSALELVSDRALATRWCEWLCLWQLDAAHNMLPNSPLFALCCFSELCLRRQVVIGCLLTCCLHKFNLQSCTCFCSCIMPAPVVLATTVH